METIKTARNIARAIGASLYERHGYDAKYSAQRNLSGRTHYADDDTLRFFHSRILRTWTECDGLVLCIIESAARDMDNRSRGFRFVAFDLFGSVIERADIENMRATRTTAEKDAGAWLAGFDVLAHYRDAMTERAERLEREAANMRAAVAALESVPA